MPSVMRAEEAHELEIEVDVTYFNSAAGEDRDANADRSAWASDRFERAGCFAAPAAATNAWLPACCYLPRTTTVRVLAFIVRCAILSRDEITTVCVLTFVVWCAQMWR